MVLVVSEAAGHFVVARSNAVSIAAKAEFSTYMRKGAGGFFGRSTTGSHGLPQGLRSEDILHYAYAVLHSPGYRSHFQRNQEAQ